MVLSLPAVTDNYNLCKVNRFYCEILANKPNPHEEFTANLNISFCASINSKYCCALVDLVTTYVFLNSIGLFYDNTY